MRAHHWRIGIHPTGIDVDHQVLAAVQHHGAPTRLMDVTSNRWVALCFARETAGTDVGDFFGIRRTYIEVLRPVIQRFTVLQPGSTRDPAGWH